MNGHCFFFFKKKKKKKKIIIIIIIINDTNANTSRTGYLRLIRGSFTKNLMTHREVINRLLMLMKPESSGVIFGIGQWNTEEMLVG